jgi:hypothetical protein
MAARFLHDRPGWHPRSEGMRPTFLVLSCPLKLADGSVGMLSGTSEGLQIQYCASLWLAWVSYLTQIALLRASADISLDLAVIGPEGDVSDLVLAAEREYESRGMPIPLCRQIRTEDGVGISALPAALQARALA